MTELVHKSKGNGTGRDIGHLNVAATLRSYLVVESFVEETEEWPTGYEMMAG